jgi:integrase
VGRNPYLELDPGNRENWYAGHLGEFRFTNLLDSHLNELRRRKFSENSIRRKRIHITTCCRILFKDRGILFTSQVDSGCFAYLDSLMSNLTKTVSSRILFDLNEFIIWCCGNNPLRDFLERRVPKKEYISSPEYVEFESLINEYRQELEGRGYRPRSVQSMTYMVREGYNLVCEQFGPIPAKDLDFRHIRAVRFCLTDLKQSTMKLYLSNLGRMLEFFFGSNPYRISGLRWSKESVNRTWITRQEWHRLWESADSEERVVLALAGGMGLRRAEIAGVMIEDIGKTLVIRGKGSGPRGKEVERPIPPAVRNALAEYISNGRKTLARETDSASGSLLVMDSIRAGAPCTVRHVETILRRLSNRTGVRFSAHTLRRYYCMALYDAGVDLDTIRRMMRHENLDTTLNCYIRADPRRLTETSNLVEQVIFG